MNIQAILESTIERTGRDRSRVHRPLELRGKQNLSGLGGIFWPRGSVLGVPGGVPRGARFGGPGGPPGGPGGARARGGPDFGGPPLRTNCGGWPKLHRKIHFLVCTRARARAPRAPRKHRNVDISGSGLIRSVDRLRVRDSTADGKNLKKTRTENKNYKLKQVYENERYIVANSIEYDRANRS